jgi:hypothetical protein
MFGTAADATEVVVGLRQILNAVLDVARFNEDAYPGAFIVDPHLVDAASAISAALQVAEQQQEQCVDEAVQSLMWDLDHSQ